MRKIFVEMTDEEYEQYNKLKTPDGALQNLLDNGGLEFKQQMYDSHITFETTKFTSYTGNIGIYKIEITTKEVF